METSKIDPKRKIASLFLWIGLFATMFSSCDVLEPDADLLESKVSLTEDQLYVLPNNAAFIDLGAKITTNKPVRFTITSSTRHGNLSDMGNGLLQYTSTSGNRSIQDSFEFTVFSEKNEVIKLDTVIIIVDDSTHLPCGIFPVNDYVYGVQKNTPININVLANDHICGTDSADLIVQIYKPDNNFPPNHGSAQVSGQNIIYTAGSTFGSQDKIIYKVFPRGQENKAAYGMVNLSGTTNCRFSLKNDFLTFTEDSLKRTVYLPVLSKDSLCHSVNQYQLNVAQPPVKGSAVVSQSGFTYTVSDPATISSSFADFFYYELCIDATCKTARVDIKVKNDSVITCVFRAFPDSINLAGNTDALVYLDVLQNDSLCSGFTNFRITQMPRNGQAFISTNKIGYQRNAPFNHSDSLEYEVCNPTICRKAKVFIK